MEILKVVFGVTAAIILTGIALDEAASGKYGTMAQSIAKKATRGYGAAA